MMNRSILLAVAIGATGWGLLGADTAPASTGGAAGDTPKIQFAELTYDFGRVDSGGVVKHDYVFTNVGNAVLEITDVKPGCGCTTAGDWDKRVAPGQTGRIPIQFHTAGFSGATAKSANVACNDPTQTNVILVIKGTVWRPIDLIPASAYFSIPAEAPTNETKIVRIINNLDTPLTLAEPVCTNRAFRAELKTLKEGKEFELQVTVDPSLVPTYVQAQIHLKTSSTNPPVLTIPAYANVQPAVTAVPSVIVLPPGPLPTATQPAVTIRNSGTNLLALSDAAINLDGASVSVSEQQPGRVFTLSVSLPAGLLIQSTQRVHVTVKSNHPKFPILTVPVVQQQRPPAAVTASPGSNQPPGLLARPAAVPKLQ